MWFLAVENKIKIKKTNTNEYCYKKENKSTNTKIKLLFYKEICNKIFITQYLTLIIKIYLYYTMKNINRISINNIFK